MVYTENAEFAVINMREQKSGILRMMQPTPKVILKIKIFFSLPPFLVLLLGVGVLQCQAVMARGTE